MTPLWKLKPGPILRWSRALHMAWGAGATTAGGLIGGDWGMGIGGVGATLGGFAWESLNKKWPIGPHMYGDGWDFLAFVAGAFVPAIIKSLF